MCHRIDMLLDILGHIKILTSDNSMDLYDTAKSKTTLNSWKSANYA